MEDFLEMGNYWWTVGLSTHNAKCTLILSHSLICIVQRLAVVIMLDYLGQPWAAEDWELVVRVPKRLQNYKHIIFQWWNCGCTYQALTSVQLLYLEEYCVVFKCSHHSMCKNVSSFNGNVWLILKFGKRLFRGRGVFFVSGRILRIPWITFKIMRDQIFNSQNSSGCCFISEYAKKSRGHVILDVTLWLWLCVMTLISNLHRTHCCMAVGQFIELSSKP